MTAPTSRTPFTETAAPPQRKALNPIVKFALELGPLALFFIVFSRLGIFAATAILMVGVMVTLAVSYAVLKRIPIMPLVTAVRVPFVIDRPSGGPLMHRAILKPIIFLIISVVGSPSFAASEPMPIGPVPVQIPVKGVIVSTVGAGAIQIETHADRSDLAMHLSVPLDDLERQGPWLAQALGLNIDECHGLPLNVHVTRVELQPAAPNLVLVLHGTVRGWLCKPIKTVLTPELDVTGKTTLAVRVGADHSISVEPAHTALDVKGLDSLGAAGGIVRNLVSVLEKRIEAGLSGEMTEHALHLDRLVAPAAISGVTAAFAEKSIEISLTGSLSAANATILAAKLINGSISK